VDLASYNTEESADDLDAVRRALRLDTIAIYGASYGSHLGLAYLRRHGEHVERAVLSRVEGPDHTWKLPGTVQRHLEHVDALLSGDPAWRGEPSSLLEQLARLLERLEASPVVVSIEPREDDPDAADVAVGSDEDRAERIALSALDLQIAVARALDSADGIASLPASLQRFERGDWSGLLETARDNRRVGVHAMALMMDCASGASRGRRLAMEREIQDGANLLGDAMLAPFYPAACVAAGSPDLGDGFRGTLRSDVPVLFVSGTLDVRTPPENVEQIRGGFSNHVHVLVENAGHPSRELMSGEYRDLLQAFLRGEAIEDCRITLPEPFFESIDGADRGAAAQR